MRRKWISFIGLISLGVAACNGRPDAPSTSVATPLAVATATTERARAVPTTLPTATTGPTTSAPTYPIGDPPPCSAHDLVYHPGLHMVLLVNCNDEQTGEPTQTHLWGWDGQNWVVVSDDGPPSRQLGGVTYDSQRDALLLFGGRGRTANYTDMWAWHDQQWQQLETAQPGTLSNHLAMVYDPQRDRTILYGGQDLQERTYHDTWEWDGTQWQQKATTGPSLNVHYALTYDGARQQLLLLGEGPNELWTWPEDSWQRINTSDGPPTRAGGRMAYDATTEQVVLFGGRDYDRRLQLDDTWLWDGESWAEWPGDGPTPRSHHSLAYNPENGRILLYGGYDGGTGNLDDTWEWDGEQWRCVHHCAESATAVATPTPPPAPTATPVASLQLGNWYGLVYDTRLQQPLLVNGGSKSGNAPLEIWGWAGDEWTLLAADPAGPSWRNFPGLAYDSQRQQLVVYGGSQSYTRKFDETWEWGAQGWQQRDVNGPGSLDQPHMVYDAAHAQTVLFAGVTSDTMLTGTWTWDGTTWQLASEAGPLPRVGAAFEYDALHENVFMFGGHTGQQPDLQDTWLWDGVNWQQAAAPGPGPHNGPAAAFDAARAHMLVFGGLEGLIYGANTWQWDGANWTQLDVPGPPGRFLHAMTYDAAHQEVLLVGGFDEPGSQPLPDTWSWDGTAWRCRANCPEVGALYQGPFDAAERVRLYG